jgi:hypothetical protein
MMHRSAMSLMEITIATALFATILVITAQALTGIRRLVNTNVAGSSLAQEARHVLDTVAEDLANSAWLVDAVTDLEQLASSDAYDREGARYYPYVVVQDYETATGGDPASLKIEVNGVPDTAGWDADLIRPEAEIATPRRLLEAKPGLPTAPDSPTGHLGFSQEIIFLKVKKSPSVQTPEFLDSDWVDFNQNAAPMAAYNRPDNLPVLESLVLADDGQETVDMPLNWETWPGADPWDEAANTFDSDQIRHYSYALVPGGRYGHRLERRFRNETSDDVELDRVVSEMVDRIVFETYRTSTELGINQIRVRVWLSRPSEDNLVQPDTYYAETLVALRSTVDPEYSLRLTDWMGQAGDFGF